MEQEEINRLAERLQDHGHLTQRDGLLALIETCGAAASTLLNQAERVKALEAALNSILAGTYPRPIGKVWRADGTPSKHDTCVHGAWMYEACENCVDAFISTALEQTGSTDG